MARVMSLRSVDSKFMFPGDDGAPLEPLAFGFERDKLRVEFTEFVFGAFLLLSDRGFREHDLGEATGR